jgi:Dyp-type peroxidase family
MRYRVRKTFSFTNLCEFYSIQIHPGTVAGLKEAIIAWLQAKYGMRFHARLATAKNHLYMPNITEDMLRTRNLSKNDKKVRHSRLLQRYRAKRFQRGIEVPKPGEQEHILIVRIDLAPGSGKKKRKEVIDGLHKLCGLFSRLESGTKTLDRLNKKGLLESKKISEYPVNFSFTIGFGIGFFDKLGIIRNRPSKLKSMPDHKGLGDVTPYSLAQTDMIIQIGSNSDFINRWVYENVLEPGTAKSESKVKEEDLAEDIVSAVKGWAIITDVHSGFQRTDGRNLMGFNDGVSNPNPGSGKKFDNVVWTTSADEGPELKDGTYMVFQKISHDLDQWRELSVEEQEEWVGRDKVTGLLLGTFDDKENQEFKKKVLDGDRAAREKLARMIKKQSDPEFPFFDKPKFRDRVPAWSHVRKVNPRGEKIANGRPLQKRIIFRRGYPFIQTGLNNKTISGLLFISFQRDIEGTFEYIKYKMAGNKNFPVPDPRDFTEHEKSIRKSQGVFTKGELDNIIHNPEQRKLLGLDDDAVLDEKEEQVKNPNSQNTGREGLAGPSELGEVPTGEFLAIVPFGGGYYFVPPFPNKSIKDLGQQFFKNYNS